MEAFTESNYQFRFSKDWKVKKYDTHPYYIHLSGVGLSAVDFVGINGQGEIFLLEVKNYKNRPVNQLERTKEKLTGTPPLLALQFIEKVEETIKGIHAIYAHLKRSWWYRFWFTTFQSSILKKQRLRHDRIYWMYASSIIRNQSDKVNLLLFLELPTPYESYRASLTNHLTQHFHPQNVQIINAQNLPAWLDAQTDEFPATHSKS